jgi:CDP-diacylglycerol--glycerol-3-phosphate 3-phosphatidyltransferase
MKFLRLAFHGKGLWYCPPGKETEAASLPSFTIIGSSNFGYRSVYRDPELNLLIQSKCEKFQKNLDKVIFYLNYLV